MLSDAQKIAKYLVVCELVDDDDHAGTTDTDTDAFPYPDVTAAGTQTASKQVLVSRGDTYSSRPEVTPAVDLGVATRRAVAAVHVSLSEFAVLDNGQRFLLRDDRGLGLGPNQFNVWQRWNQDRLTRFICEYIVEDHIGNSTICDSIMEQFVHTHHLVIDRSSLQTVLSASPTVEFGSNIQAKWQEHLT